MKILHILTDSNIGGAGILLENALIYSSLPRSCFTVVLPRGAALAPRLRARGIRVKTALRGHDRSLSLGDFFRLVAIIRQEKPHILHTHASLSGRLAGWLCGVPVRLATRHCAYPVGRRGNPFARWLHRKLDKHLATGTIATAQAAANNLIALGIPQEKILLIRNGAREIPRLPERLREDLRRSLGIDEGDFVIGICARLAPVKDHSTLLRAANILLSQHTGYHFLIVGSGTEEERLRRTVADMGIEHQVTFTGYVEDPTPYLNLFDVAVNCSMGTETSCLALSEAMSLGIPCVASRFGGNPELVREGENGLLFDAGDDRALAACLARLCRDKLLYDRLALGAQERYRRDLRAESMAHAYDRLYLALYDAPREHGELLMPPPRVRERFFPFP
ncbi:MAG: glycosyltransferase [Clostridia bacterium]|nr:glycosyltransferase [Clostridia bacterium]